MTKDVCNLMTELAEALIGLKINPKHIIAALNQQFDDYSFYRVKRVIYAKHLDLPEPEIKICIMPLQT